MTAALLTPARAAAALFGELPFRPVAGVATCLRATGAPGELVRWTPGGIELLHADSSGLTPIETVRLGRGRGSSCPLIAAQPNGAAVAALLQSDLRDSRVSVALRDPDGHFGPPVSLPVGRGMGAEFDSIAVAVSPRGDAVVGVTQSTCGASAAARSPSCAVPANRSAPHSRYPVGHEVSTRTPSQPPPTGAAR